jgi:hypothetical protein
MPVLSRIHWSLVSMSKWASIRMSSSLLKCFSGNADPIPVILAAYPMVYNLTPESGRVIQVEISDT